MRRPMSQDRCVHIIDPDHRRRAAIVRQLCRRAIHAETYDDLDEFESRSPLHGAVLINDDLSFPSGRARTDGMGSPIRHLPVAFYATDPSPSKIVKAMRAGALNYLQWPFTRDELNDYVVSLTCLGEAAADRKAEARRRAEHLTQRELDVLIGLMEGKSSREIATTLGISSRTEEIHRHNMKTRLGARSTAEAIRIAHEAGLRAEPVELERLLGLDRKQTVGPKAMQRVPRP
jgi:two-component system, LuxR family, response regulator FixJ